MDCAITSKFVKHGVIIELRDLFAFTLKGDNVKQVVNDWNPTMNLLQTVPNEEVLEYLFRAQLEKSVKLKEMMTLIDKDIVHRGEKKELQNINARSTSTFRTSTHDKNERWSR